MWNLISFAQSRIRRLCLESLSSGPKMPTSVAKLNNLHISHVSRALRELEKKNLVECLTPDATKNRIYQITGKGATVLKKIEEMD